MARQAGRFSGSGRDSRPIFAADEQEAEDYLKFHSPEAWQELIARFGRVKSRQIVLEAHRESIRDLAQFERELAARHPSLPLSAHRSRRLERKHREEFERVASRESHLVPPLYARPVRADRVVSVQSHMMRKNPRLRKTIEEAEIRRHGRLLTEYERHLENRLFEYELLLLGPWLRARRTAQSRLDTLLQISEERRDEATEKHRCLREEYMERMATLGDRSETKPKRSGRVLKEMAEKYGFTVGWLRRVIKPRSLWPYVR
jgi:hypothetical protein